MSSPESTVEDGLCRRITQFVTSWGAEGDRDELFLELFAYQYEHNAPFRRFCEAREATPRNCRSWREIPAAPADAFRTQDLTCRPGAEAAVFYTSGTSAASGMAAGRHFMDDSALALYSLSLRTSFDRLASRASGLPIRAILAPSADAPHSSLSYMVSSLASDAPGLDHWFFWEQGGPMFEAAISRLKKDCGPVLLFVTAFALLELLERMATPLQLHPQSMIIETGGFKGRRQAIGREELYARASHLLGIPVPNIGSEYGMCEMASQFYDNYLQRGHPAFSLQEAAAANQLARPVKVGPPWVRTRFIDPATGTEAREGQPGIMCHYDLCNLNSVCAIQTLDVGEPAPGGSGFILHGRLQGAPARGCSLTIEEWLASVS